MENPQKQPAVVKPPAPGPATKLTLPYSDSIATDVDVFTISNALGEGQSNADISRLSTIVGRSAIAHGVHGVNSNGGGGAPKLGTGVWGESDNGFGVYGASVSNSGVQGISSGFDGVHGESQSPAHAGVSGVNQARGIGVYGASSGEAGHFEGNVTINGTLTHNGNCSVNG